MLDTVLIISQAATERRPNHDCGERALGSERRASGGERRVGIAIAIAMVITIAEGYRPRVVMYDVM